MKKAAKILSLAMALVVTAAGIASATPSTQIWIPSTDVQAYKSLHLGIDNYIRTSHNDGEARDPNVYDLGITAGVLPFEKVQLEVGADYIVNGTDPGDQHPLYFNAKLGTPEGALFGGSPALAVGGYNFGTEEKVTDYNIVYALAAKTLPVVGRISAGYYLGSSYLLNNKNGNNDNTGVLLSWDRTMTEISDKLWMAVDYQGGQNAVGALSFGASWAFSKNVSVIFGYDIYNNDNFALGGGGKNTFTTQLDINFP